MPERRQRRVRRREARACSKERRTTRRPAASVNCRFLLYFTPRSAQRQLMLFHRSFDHYAFALCFIAFILSLSVPQALPRCRHFRRAMMMREHDTSVFLPHHVAEDAYMLLIRVAPLRSAMPLTIELRRAMRVMSHVDARVHSGSQRQHAT